MLLPIGGVAAAWSFLIALPSVEINTASPPPSLEGSALYVTTRPLPQSNAAFYAVNGKVLPLTAQRIPDPTFPLNVQISGLLDPYSSLSDADASAIAKDLVVR